jgi:hypothetical protein
VGVSSVTTYFEWTTSGLPEDTLFSTLGDGLLGNGQWDCGDYWAISHPGVAAPASINGVSGTCGTPATTTFSRYQIYRYEISQGTGPAANETWAGASTPNESGGVGDWSGRTTGWPGNGQSDVQGASNRFNGNGQTENGYPYCAAHNGVSAVDVSTGGLDRRNIIVPVVNCLAPAELGNITGGSTANNVPVAAFGKFFLTQPVEALGSTAGLYGEMSGAVNNNDNVTIYNMVQLYR